jgi:NAD(P)-dependent dehydrogenase (short-subunit alcohol dehydrogenase family)
LYKSKCKYTFVSVNKKQFKMKIIITGSLGNIGKPLAKQLVSAGHEVTVISSNAERKQAIEEIGAKAAIGSVSDSAFLADTFAGADALFAMTPPNLGGKNVISNTVNAGRAFAEAIKKANIKRVVMLSSIGAHLPNGTGPIAGLHPIEALYNELDNTALTILRAGFFYTNLYNDVPMIKGTGIMGAIILLISKCLWYIREILRRLWPKNCKKMRLVKISAISSAMCARLVKLQKLLELQLVKQICHGLSSQMNNLCRE